MKKNKNKWAISLASAALVASAIVPVASATSFTDVEKNVHKDAILALAEAGIISGYPDGTFRPNAIVTRSNVTKLLGKWLVTEGYKIPEDYKTVARFSDLPVDYSDQELVQYAALVKDTGVFKGSNNQLMHVNNMSREQMAVVLVRAINTVYGVDIIADYKAAKFESQITDLDKAMSDEKREAIIALEYKEITKVKTFNPKNILTRGQFASFLNRSIENITKDTQLAVDEVEEQIKNLPADKDILAQGNKILSAKTAYDELTDYGKTLVNEESKTQLEQAVSKFILFNKSDINGLQLKISRADSLEKKKAVVEAAKANLEIAKALGISEAEYNFLNDMILAGEKTVTKEAVAEVEAQIKNLPEDKDILEQGNKILSAKTAYDALSDSGKALVSEESKTQLDQAVSKFILFNKSDINGLQLKISKADSLEAKKAIVKAAKANLEIAKALGISEAEYNFLNDMIIAGEKTVTKEAVAEVEAQIKNLPEDKDILAQGNKILSAKTAYDALSDYGKALVSEESKTQLEQAVSKFILFNKSDINGLQLKISRADSLEAKKAVVEAAKANLEIAKALGISEAEYNFLNDIIVAGEKTIANGL